MRPFFGAFDIMAGKQASGETMPVRFFYFDLGKVLLDFDMARMVRQMSDVSGAPVERVAEAIFEGGLQQRAESGEISDREFHEAFCRQTGTRPDYEELRLAGSDIFELKAAMVPLVSQFRAAGHRMGILSNTCRSHWEYCARRYRILATLFDVAALSFELHAVKPERAIFLAAAELAGCQPDEIFFVDDTPGHVEGARAAGYDAVAFLSPPQLAA
ncbi:MAG: HAD family phosphatase, partial [Planctomycetia bacterium]|nr:HAD family phosphatase [Planctomycetia bacterium]